MFKVPIIVWIDSLNYIFMSLVYLALTIYFSIQNGVFIDFSYSNPVNYLLALLLTMPY